LIDIIKIVFLLLIVCKGIVNLHGGTLDVSSEGEGLGSTFSVLLPMTIGAHSDKAAVHPSAMLRVSSTSNTQNIKAATSSQAMQMHLQRPLTSLFCGCIGRRNESRNRAMVTSPQWSLPVTIGQIKPAVRSTRWRNSSVNLRIESAVEMGRRESVTTDVIRNEFVLARPFSSTNVNNSQSVCNDICDVKTSSINVVHGLGMHTEEEFISDICEQRSHSGMLRHQIIGNALEHSEPRSPTRVLIVDDVVMNRKMLRRVLESRFDLIDEAEDGQKAVEIIAKSLEGGEAFLYDVITMDYQMPVMDGVTATRHIRSLGFLGKIIAVTGNALEEDVLTFKASGADTVLMKPLDIRQFDAFMRSDFEESK
jgi:CheY-like chemotaxis protein